MTRKDDILPETKTTAVKPEDLHAELHEGHDPSAESHERGNLFGVMSAARRAEHEVMPAETTPAAKTENAVQSAWSATLKLLETLGLREGVEQGRDHAGPMPGMRGTNTIGDTSSTITPQSSAAQSGIAPAGVSGLMARNGTLAHSGVPRAEGQVMVAGSSGPAASAPAAPPPDPTDHQHVLHAPVIHMVQASGVEDEPVFLSIVVTGDAGAETTVTLSGLPAGAMLSAGHQNPDGSWTLSPAELSGLQMLPPGGWSGSITLDVTAVSRDGNETLSATAHNHVLVAGVASAPYLDALPVSGTEDSRIPLHIDVHSTDPDGSEIISLIISGVPRDARLSAGAQNPDGSWTLTPAELQNLELIPAPHASGAYNLVITATAAENGTAATSTTSLPVEVLGIATPPVLIVTPAAGIENLPVSLHIAAGLQDADGSETLGIIITGVPADATLSAGNNDGDGRWILSPDDLAGLTLTLPQSYNGTLQLTVTAASVENGTAATVVATLPVSITAVADMPVLAVQPAAGLEDTSIPLTIQLSSAHGDGAEALSVTIGGLPAGAVLSAGAQNSDGSWTLSPAQLDGLNLVPAPNWNGVANLTITATASENGTTASTSAALPVAVGATADAPLLTVGAAAGFENAPIALNITATPAAGDAGVISLVISGLPAGATLSAGTHNADDSWTLSPSDLPGLTLTPPSNMSGTLQLTLTATASENGTSASTTTALPITIEGVASVPQLAVHNASGLANAPIPLDIQAVATDNDGSETLAIVISGIPSGGQLSAGHDNGDGSWRLTPEELAGLTFTPPQGSAAYALTVTATASENGTAESTALPLIVNVGGVAAPPDLAVTPAAGREDSPIALSISAALSNSDAGETLQITVTGLPAGAVLSAGQQNADGSWTLEASQLSGLTLTPPQNWNGSAVLTVTATAEENGTAAHTIATLPLLVSGAADAPVLVLQPAAGLEDTPIALDISAVLAPGDAGMLSITLSNLPPGAVLSAGTRNADGSWSLTPPELTGLTLTPPANWSGAAQITVTATASENGSTAQTTGGLVLTVLDTADAPLLQVQPASGAEHGAIALDISAALAPGDGGDLTLSLSGLPAGATLSAGHQNADGSWTLTSAELQGLTLIPAGNWNGSANIIVTATASENGTSASTAALLPLTITGVANAPDLALQAASGVENQPVALVISTALAADDHGSLGLVLTGLPPGALLSAGHDNGDGSWTLSPADLPGLQLIPSPGWNGSATLNITSTVTENGTSASTAGNLLLTLAGVADAPQLSVQASAGTEDAAVALNISAALAPGDHGDLHVTLSGLPAGATLSAGAQNTDGSWVLAAGELQDLLLLPPPDWNGGITLTVTATATENGTSASTSALLPVTIAGTADAPALAVQAAIGAEDTFIALSISPALAFGDQGDLTITISGLPAGAVLSAGTQNGDGSWTLSNEALSGLSLQPTAGWNGSASLLVTATVTENGTTASTAMTLPVTVTGVADAPALSLLPATGLEDAPIALNISAALATGDHGALEVVIAGLPPGAALSAGTQDADGDWHLTAQDLPGLMLTPPADWNGSANLSVTAIATENGTTASTAANLPLVVTGLADLPLLQAQPAAGAEDTPVALTIHASQAAGDHGALSIVLSGLPDGATLSAGAQNADGSWSLTPAELQGLTLTPPPDWNGAVTLMVTATASENGSTASTTVPLALNVAGVADAPVLTVTPAIGLEDGAIQLDITAALAEGDHGALTLLISGLPSGATLSAGTQNADGSWSLTGAQLSGLALLPAPDWHGSANVTVTATVSENGSSASTAALLPLTVLDAADAPILAAHSAAGLEGTPIPLLIDATLAAGESGSLTITLSDLPAGAALSAGTANADGSWTLSAAQLTGLKLIPAADWNGDATLTVTATVAENGTTASAAAPLPLHVIAAADAPPLSVFAATGPEDSAIALNIVPGIPADADASLSVTLFGLPAGATLSAGAQNGDGSWTLAAPELAGLSLLPPANWNGSASLTVVATVTENGTSASTAASMPLLVTGVADAPALQVQAATGLEDSALPLVISTALAAGDHGSLSITISGLPAGAALSAGTHNGDGSWTLTAAQLAHLSLVPAANWNGSASLAVTATATENGTSASTVVTLPVTVAAVADAPLLAVNAATGPEDAPLALNILPSLASGDHGALSITIADLPMGAMLSAGTQNSDGSWTLTTAELAGLTLTPAANWNGTGSLTVTATATENGTSASTSASLLLNVTGVADAPTLSLSAATGLEDSSIPLTISAGLASGDHGSLSFTISQLPAGATLSAGVVNADGSWTVTPAQLAGLSLLPAPDWNGSATLTVTATTAENGTSASTSGSLLVTVTGVADAPTLTLAAATGLEDTQIPLIITGALAAGDHGSLDFTISGLPAGATLSAGTQNADGSWNLSASQLAGLSLVPAADWNGSAVLSVTATASENGTAASTSGTLAVTVTGVSDVPTLNVIPSSGLEDTAIPLVITAALAAGDHGDVAITISGLPPGASLSAGTQQPDGSWSFTASQLSGLSLLPAANWNGTATLTVTATSLENGTSAAISAPLAVTVTGVADAPVLAVQPSFGVEDMAVALHISPTLAAGDNGIMTVTIDNLPPGATLSAGTHNADGSWTLEASQLTGLNLLPGANWNGNASLSVSVTAVENGTSATTSTSLGVTVTGVADAPHLSVSAAAGWEGGAIALNILPTPAIGDHGDLLVTVSGLPAGAALSAGTHNGDGSWTLTQAQLPGLTLLPAAHWNGAGNLTITATATENGTSAATTAALPFNVQGVADAPSLGLQAAAGIEDAPIALNITPALATGDHGSLAVTISGLPDGSVLSAGTHNSDGSWTLTPAQLPGLTLTPPANWSGALALTIIATATENGTTASTSGSLAVTIAGVADAPAVSALPAMGLEDHALPLTIGAALADIDGSESLSISISNLPPGASLSAGTHNSDGSWTLTASQLSGLSLVPAANWSGSANLTITATASEAGTSASTTATLPVTVSGVADMPVLRVMAATGAEDTPIALNIGAALTDTDGSETLTIGISGLPAGAILSAGIHNADGTWSLTAAQLANLTLTPPANFNGSLLLTVAAMASEGGTSASNAIQLPVTVVPVGDLPTLSVAASAAGSEDSAIPLTINAALSNASETLSIVISGLPEGAMLSHGSYDGNGHWSLNAADLSGLTVTPPANYAGTMALTVSAISSDAGGTAAIVTLPVTVTVAPVADTPLLSVAAAVGNEDTAIPLSISAALGDTDGSEALSISISGVPAGATLSAGTNAGGGVWTLTPAQLSGLTLTPPANADADFNLTVTATARESNNAATSTAATLAVTVHAVADVPTVSAANATGQAGTPIALTIGGSATDSSETVSYIVHGVPDGFALNHGTNNGDNSWTLSAADLAGLKITAPPTFEGQLNLYAQTVSHDNDDSIASSAALPFYVRIGNYSTGYLVDLGVNLHLGGVGVGVHVGLLPDIDLFPASGGITQTAGIYMKEDTSFTINDAPLLTGLSILSGLTNLIAKIQFQNVPTGVTFNTGTNKGGGVWEFSLLQLGSLVMSVPANSDSDFTILVVSKMLLGLADIALVSTPVHVLGVADAPTLAASAVNTTEDHAITLNITGALADTDGSETISYLVSGMPTGFTLNHGTDNGNGSWSLSTADLAGLAINPAANWSGTANFTVSAVATEREGDMTVRQQAVSVAVAAVADAPVITAVPATVLEGHAVTLNLGIALADTDGSESISAVKISGLPAGSVLTNATDNHDGTWSADVTKLGQIQLTPPAHWSGDINLSVTATAQEGANGSVASTTGIIPVHVTAVADTPVLSAANASGAEDQPVALHLGAALADTDGSEHLSAVISGLPADAHLSAGINNGDGSWTLTQSQLNALTLLPPTHYSGDMDLSLTVYSQEANGSTASASQQFSVHVAASGADGSWLTATVDTAGSAPAAVADAAQQAVDAAATIAHDPGSDYQHVFQNHQS